MATKVYYNDIDLGLIKTMKVEQRSKYDPSNTDMLFVVNKFTLRSIISKLDAGAMAPMIAGDANPAATMERIRTQLLLPRRRFRYIHSAVGGDTTLLDIDGDTEANNGPKPLSVDIVQVTEKTYIIDYVIEVADAGCDTEQQFASNRFETTHDIDHKGYSTITTLGRVIVRSDMKRSPDALRPVITPPMPEGFRRKSMYQITEDGLAMNYRIVDTELYLAPPANAVEAKGRFSITAVPPGALLWAQVDIHLEGRKDQSKRQLMETAVLMALRRLEDAGIMEDPISKKPFVMGGALSEELFDNVVEVQLKGQILLTPKLVGSNAQFNFFNGFWKGFLGSTLGLTTPGIWGQIAAKWAAGDGKGMFSGSAPLIAGGIPGLILGAIGAAKGEGAKAAANTQVEQPDPKRPPKVAGATLEKGMLDRFGAAIEGTDQRGSIDPGLRGNLGFLGLVAAAFRDPCVVEAVERSLSTNPNKPDSHTMKSKGPRPAERGERAGRTFEFETDGRQEEVDGTGAIQAAWRGNELLERLAWVGDASSPSYDWRRGRLEELRPILGNGITNAIEGILDSDGNQLVEGGVFAGRLIAQVAMLPEEEKPVQYGDPYPGWYENWYCEVSHELDMNTDVLPATAVGQSAVKAQWANPLRTVKIRWAATKAGFPPEVPLIAGDTNTIVLKHNMELPTVEIAPDGQTVRFTASGETWYKTLDEEFAEVHWPTPPWLRAPMRFAPAPIPDPSIVVTNGESSAAQQALIDQADGGGLVNANNVPIMNA